MSNDELKSRALKLLINGHLTSKQYEKISHYINLNEFGKAREELNKYLITDESNTHSPLSKNYLFNHFNLKNNDDELFLTSDLEKIKSERKKLEATVVRNQLKLEIAKQDLNKISNELATKNSEYDELLSKFKTIEAENLDMKNQSQQTRIDEKIPEYVQDVSEKLDKADDFFSKMSLVWACVGIAFSVAAIIASFCTFAKGSEAIFNNGGITKTTIFYIFIRGGLGIALLSWVSYISFSNARNYTHEAILRKDRQHALTFGRLFLQIYGSTATKEDAIKVFKDWNMSGKTAFSSKTTTPPSPFKVVDSTKEIFAPSIGEQKKHKPIE